MREVCPDGELALLLAKYAERGGVIDYVLLEFFEETSPDELHRAAALAGIAAIEPRLVKGFRLHWDASKLTGKRVPFSEFWGGDDVEETRISEDAWSTPLVDGYKTAFFQPPHYLHGHFRGSGTENQEMFAGINKFVLGENPQSAEIFSWSTDWSNYFEAGLEWWGAFMWTVRAAGAHRMTVIAASTTD